MLSLGCLWKAPAVVPPYRCRRGEVPLRWVVSVVVKLPRERKLTTSAEPALISTPPTEGQISMAPAWHVLPSRGSSGVQAVAPKAVASGELGGEAVGAGGWEISSFSRVLASPSGSLALHRAALPSPSPCNATIKWEGSWALR